MHLPCLDLQGKEDWMSELNTQSNQHKLTKSLHKRKNLGTISAEKKLTTWVLYKKSTRTGPAHYVQFDETTKETKGSWKEKEHKSRILDPILPHILHKNYTQYTQYYSSNTSTQYIQASEHLSGLSIIPEIYALREQSWIKHS